MTKRKTNKNFTDTFPCDACKRNLNSYGKLEEHREYFHGNSIEKILSPKKCPTCQQSYTEGNCPNCNL